VGQSKKVSGIAWTADDWVSFYSERAAIREYGGRQSRQEAEREALAETIEQWRAMHPLPPSGPEIGCIQCRTAAGDADLLPHVAAGKGHVWIHQRCWKAFDLARRQEARAALHKMVHDQSRYLADLLDGGPGSSNLELGY
jgi:hypothetical protein